MDQTFNVHSNTVGRPFQTFWPKSSCLQYLSQLCALTLKSSAKLLMINVPFPENGVPSQGTYIIWLKIRMLPLNAIIEDGHHHTLPSVPSPPGLRNVHASWAAFGLAAALWSKYWDIKFSPQEQRINQALFWALSVWVCVSVFQTWAL